MKKNAFVCLSACILLASCGKDKIKMAKDLSYDGYNLKFEENFNGKELDESVWNYEEHPAGWVNNELQSYIISERNVYLKNGNLIIQPEKFGGIYTSGRINTQGKKDFKYGIFEARLKVPRGKGFLPAFWMMPTDESMYGQWPKCGEIDIMEVLGDKLSTTYGTLHFGEPHTMSQVSYDLEKGNFADEFHVYSLEWLPDEMKFYVDGKYIGNATEWFSKKAGDDEITFPAPYDQKFYMILNVAVGGNWPGNPDKTTTFDEKSQMVVDYVKVYQKDSYDENVKMKVQKKTLRKANTDGNFVNNGDFSSEENLSDDADWKFMTQMGGNATATLENGEIKIETKNPGSVDYAVQLVQGFLPLQKGVEYEFKFDARASEDRDMHVGICSPDKGYMRYFGDETAKLGTEKKTYSYKFSMKDSDDPNGRIDYNMGAFKSIGTIWISNVSLKATGTFGPSRKEKTVLSDGNYIYNGKFDKGDDRLKYWCYTKDTEISVTNVDNVRECRVDNTNGEAALYQEGLGLNANIDYLLSFKCSSGNAESISVKVGGKKLSLEKKDGGTYAGKFNLSSVFPKPDVEFVFGKNEVYLIDDVAIKEDALVLNGSFSSGLAGWELYSYTGDLSKVGIDSLHEDARGRKNNDAASVTIKDTADVDWKIQLKQNNVTLLKGKKYRLSFDAYSTMKRQIKYALQRDGALWKAKYGAEDWTPYNFAPTVELDVFNQTFTNEFEMTYDDDEHTILTFSMGTINARIGTEHDVFIDNIKLEVIE